MKPTQIAVRTRSRAEFVDITRSVAGAVRESGITDGACTVFVRHTTAGVTINENADPSVVFDILNHLEKMVPPRQGYTHAEGNSDSHIKASLMGSSVTVPVSDGRMMLGTWQGIYFCEFDGPRSRSCIVTVTDSST
jgi:secondary thiamine-phosphate synthase enzyme